MSDNAIINEQPDYVQAEVDPNSSWAQPLVLDPKLHAKFELNPAVIVGSKRTPATLPKQ